VERGRTFRHAGPHGSVHEGSVTMEEDWFDAMKGTEACEDLAHRAPNEVWKALQQSLTCNEATDVAILHREDARDQCT